MRVEQSLVTEPDAPMAHAQRDGWISAERLLAVFALVVIGSRLPLVRGVTVGDAVAFAMIPLWFAATKRFIGARWLLVLGVVAVLVGVLLTEYSATDHRTSTATMIANSLTLLGVVASVGVVLWARSRLSDSSVAIAYAVGILVGLVRPTDLFFVSPWKFGFSVPAAIVILALMQRSGKRVWGVVALLVLCILATVSDARSEFSILLLTLILVLWGMRPMHPTRRVNVWSSLIALGGLALLTYSVGQALILDGFLGEETQRRSELQLQTSGNLLLGGRPELGATLGLIKDRVIGFGTGTYPNFHDVSVAKFSMTELGYDPNNNYVSRYMFGSGYRLHSVIGDLWISYGLIGILLTATIAVALGRTIGPLLTAQAPTALYLYLIAKTMWNIPFSPYYASLPPLILALGLLGMSNGQSGFRPLTPVPSRHEPLHDVLSETPGRAQLDR